MNNNKVARLSRKTTSKILIILCGTLFLCGCYKETALDNNHTFKHGDIIFSQSLEGTPPTILSTSDEYFYAEVNRSGDTVCAFNYNERTLSRLHLKNGAIQQEDVFPWYSYGDDWISNGVAHISISDEGACLFNIALSTLALMPEGAPSKIIKLPDKEFGLKRITYSPTAKTFIVAGKSSLFILKGTQEDEEIKPIRLHGSYNGIRVREGSEGELLSPDGKILYALVTGLDKGNSVKNLLASFDASSGQIIKFYLPHFKDGDQTFEGRLFTFSEDQISPELRRNSFALTSDGKTIYATAWVSGNETRTYSIDTASGDLQELSFFKKASDFQISPSGKYAINIKEGDNPNDIETYIYELNTGKLVNKVLGNYCGTIRCGH